jgi:hypothetical protein
MDPEEEHQQWHGEGELVKFMILVGILLLTVLLVAASRPLVFDWIIPAALGWEPALPGAEPDDNLAPLPAVLPESTEIPPEPTPLSPSTRELVIPAPTVTPLPTATLQIYEVQPGDNLTTIARRYGVTIDALMAANNINNPNRIIPGEVLLIPAP